MSIMTVEEAQAKLAELIEGRPPGEEILLTRDALPVAKLVRQSADLPRPICGRGRGKVLMMIEDDAHLEAFEEYMS